MYSSFERLAPCSPKVSKLEDKCSHVGSTELSINLTSDGMCLNVIFDNKVRVQCTYRPSSNRPIHNIVQNTTILFV